MARLPLLAGGFEQLNLSHREYWLCEGALGAAGRPGSGGLQCRRADYGAGAGRLVAHLKCRISTNPLTLRDAGAAKHYAVAQGDEDTQAAASDLGSGVDQQEV